MKYSRIVNKGSAAFLDDIAEQEDKMFIRIFYNGKFINYLFDPSDVENLGLSNIFDMIDPDPDWTNAKKIFSNVQSKPKRKSTSRIAS
jgi:hypothetical protein